MPTAPRIRGRRRRPLILASTALVGAVLLLPGPALARGVFVTGHDADYHAFAGPTPTGPQHIIQAAIKFTTDNKSSPKILLVTDVRDPGGDAGNNSDPRKGLVASGYPTFDVADYGSGTPGVLNVSTVDFKNYDVVFVASDEGGWLRQVELDALNARRAAVTSYVNGGGGLIALPESGLRPPGPGVDTGTSHDRLGFLPVLVSTVENRLEEDFTLTAFGSSLGLITSDVNGAGNFAHTIITATGPYTVVDQDGSGNVRTVAGKGPFYCAGGSLALSPTSQTVPVGSSGTVNGTLTDSCGNPVSGAPVTYTVISGPDNGATGTGATDSSGRTSFADRCSSAGTDTIRATTTAQGGVTSNTVTVICQAPVTMTGRAYGLSARVAPLGLGIIEIAPTPDTGSISTAAASTTTTPCVLKVTGVVTANTLCANVTTTLGPPASNAKATVQDLSLIGLAAVPAITATAVQSQSRTTCAGSTGKTTFAALKIGATSFVNYTPAANTTLNLGLAKIVLNEQVPVSGGLKVNAIHVTVPSLGTDVVVASSTSDIHGCS